MNLTKIEKETIILFNEAEQTASVYTCNKSLQNRLDRFCAENSSCYCTKQDECSKMYNLPKKWVKVRLPRQLSEKERSKLALMAKEKFHKQNSEENV